jgi:4-diphosphocytidyl-2-C-methyl-D-erythritol kinase
MNDKKIILSPAKLNIFLKVLGKRDDGYHEIRSGITFINLYDQIELISDSKTSISYSGTYKPSSGNYADCIIKKTLDFLDIKSDLNLKINIVKNIPVQGGLGAASSNAATLIKTLEKMNKIDINKPEHYASLGADIPSFLFQKNCLVTGMGEKILYCPFPKYFFLLVKPKYNNSTKNMYQYFNFNNQNIDQIDLLENIEINENDFGNDFEQFMLDKNEEYKNIFEFLENANGSIFSRMTGSGSCCYAAFEENDSALRAMELFKLNFPDLWSIVCENNTS